MVQFTASVERGFERMFESHWTEEILPLTFVIITGRLWKESTAGTSSRRTNAPGAAGELVRGTVFSGGETSTTKIALNDGDFGRSWVQCLFEKSGTIACGPSKWWDNICKR